MDLIVILVIIIILSVAIFDFTNGFHDAADIVATTIAARAMKPMVAIIIVTFFTFIAPFLVGLTVAETIGSFMSIHTVSNIEAQSIVLSGVLAAITYNLITWKFGIPSSSSNSLVGGLLGAGLYGIGYHSINWGIEPLLSGHLEGVMKIVVGLFISPLAGFFVGFLLMKLFIRLFSRFTIQNRKFFVWSQYLSISWLGFSHGANDAQKGMGIIAMVLFTSGYTTQFSVPTWVIVLSASFISLGTMFGGWNIIKTLGFGIIKVKLLHSFTNQISSAFINSMATLIGAPTSTTQVVTASLIGIGGAEKPKHIRWKVVSSIISNWFLNIPISMVIGGLYCIIFLSILR